MFDIIAHLTPDMVLMISVVIGLFLAGVGGIVLTALDFVAPHNVRRIRNRTRHLRNSRRSIR